MEQTNKPIEISVNDTVTIPAIMAAANPLKSAEDVDILSIADWIICKYVACDPSCSFLFSFIFSILLIKVPSTIRI